MDPLKRIYRLREQFLIPLIESLKMTSARSYAWFLNFLDCFLCYVLPKHSKITVTCPE